MKGRNDDSMDSFDAPFLNQIMGSAVPDSDSDDDRDTARLPPMRAPAGAGGASPAASTPTFGKRMGASHTFSIRSTLVGLALGALIVFQNMYFFLKSGLGFGGAFTAALVGWTAIRAVPVQLLAFSPMEHCYLVTVAVATGGGAIAFGFVGPLLALTESYGEAALIPPPYLDFSNLQLGLYCIGLCTFGIFLAVPFRQKFIVEDELPFPSGKATAVLIASLQRGSQRARKLSRTLFMSFTPSFCLKVLRWCFGNLDTFPMFGSGAVCYTWFEDWSTAFWGSAFLMPGEVPYGMMVGAIVQTLVLYLTLQQEGKWYSATEPPMIPGPNGVSCAASLGSLSGAYGYVQITAVAIFFVDGICLLAENVKNWLWPAEGNATPPYSPIAANVQQKDNAGPADRRARVLSMHSMDGEAASVSPVTLPSKATPDDIPTWWWVTGAVCSALLTLGLVPTAIHMAKSDLVIDGTVYAQVVFSLIIAPLFGFVVVYTYGKSDQALVLLAGKIIVAVLVLWSGNVVLALALAAVGACLSTQACDTCQVMKTAYILKASTQVMLFGQLIGAIASIPVGIAAFKLFTSVYVIPSPEFGAPLAGLFRGVAVLFSSSDASQRPPDYYLTFVWVASAYVVVYHLLRIKWESASWFRFVPAPFTLALGMYIPPVVAWDFALGSVIKQVWLWRDRASYDDRHQAVAAGMISGEGVAGVFTAVLQLATGQAHLQAIPWY